MTCRHIFLIAMTVTCVALLSPPAWSSSSNEKERMTKALRQMEKKDYERAVASFTELLKENPGLADAFLNRAASRVELKDFEGALSDYDQALKLNPNFVETYLQRAELNVKQGDLQAAISDYTQALRLNPKDADAHAKRAVAYKLNGDYAKAIEDCTATMNLSPDSIEAMEERADCKMRAYDLDGAIGDYNTLLKKYKSKVSYLNYNLGQAYQLKGDKAAAREHFDEAIAFHSKNLKTSHKQESDFLKRGLAYTEIHETDKALSDFEEAVVLAPDDANAHYQLGHLRLTTGENQKAIEELTQALKVNPKLTSALLDRAAAYAALGEFATAQKDLDTALSGEKNAEVLLSRAFARLGLGDSSGAVADLQEAKNLSAKNIDHKKEIVAAVIASKESANDLALAQSLEQMALLDLADNPTAAESLIKRALEIQEKSLDKGDPKLAYSLMLLGRVQLKKGNPLRAEALFRSAQARLKNRSDGSQKYAIFNLEDCARFLIQTSNLEKAGAILSDTRMTRAMMGLNERALIGDNSRKAERAIEAFKLKKKNEQKDDVAKKDDNSSTTTTTTRVSSASEAQQTITEPPRRNGKPLRDKWAVIVGISNFKDTKINLHYPAKDAKDFSDFLIKEKGFAPDHVKLLTDRAATRANILSLLGNKWLPRVAEPDDLVIIYFSGHGSPSSLDVGGVNYLVAYDTDVNDLYSTAIAMQDLTRIIKERVHSDRIMILLDACHSGAVATSAKGLARASNVDVDLIVQGTGQLVLSSSSPDQQSWESKRYQGSVFTKHLMDGLRRNGKMTSLGDAFSYLDEEVQREVLRDRGILQNPIMKSKWEGRDLVIGVPSAAPSKGLSAVELPDSSKPGAGTADAKIAKNASKGKFYPKSKGKLKGSSVIKGSSAKHVK